MDEKQAIMFRWMKKKKLGRESRREQINFSVNFDHTSSPLFHLPRPTYIFFIIIW